MARLTADEAGGANVLAFLDMIAHSEIGDALLLMTDDGYNVLVGSTPYKPITFNDYSAHPRILNRALNSTAAGRYQFIWRTWRGLDFPDFTPENQDRGCIELIKGRDALEVVIRGDIEAAIHLCREEWASFSGNSYGQHQNKTADLVAYFTGVLGRYT